MQVRHICYVYNNLHCYVYDIFKYIVMENTGKTVAVKKHYSPVAVQGRTVSQEEVIVLLLPLHFTSFFQQLYVYNNHIVMFIMF